MKIMEHQQGIKPWPSNYVYVGFDRASGLHEFAEHDKAELFARRKSAPAGWHLRRGAYTFEFVRSKEYDCAADV
jgi:hypothetical protein